MKGGAATGNIPDEVRTAFDGARARCRSLVLDPRWHASLPSTMDDVADAAAVGAAEGLVVVAEEQTAGRGRRGRAWSSPPGAGLYLSFLLRPAIATMPPEVCGLLTLATGVAVRAAIARATGLLADLKWPNDLMVERRKLAGVLAEGIGIGTDAQVVILGIGINLRAAAHSAEIAQRATSIEAELGRLAPRAAVLEEVLVSVPAIYRRLACGEADGILREWRAASPSADGAAVEFDSATGLTSGVTAGIDSTGALLIRTARGIERALAADVRWL